jgi:intracellular sulfur oxidation DsrE/DsrF family protein
MRTIFAALLLTVVSLTTFAADSNKMHKVLFEFTSPGHEPSTSVLNNIENVRKALGAGTQVILIAHGPGIALLQKSNTENAARMRKLADAGVVFAACENTMKRKNLTKADLFDFATTVDAGVAEVVRRQEAGWSYVKSGH